jgi:ATP-dependent Zn protease
MKRSTAYHEAGHAVIGRVLGLTCEGATIAADYDDMSAGHSICDVQRSIDDWDARDRDARRYRPRRSESMHRARIMMLMAGREAENVCLGRCGGGDGDDLREINLTLDEADAPKDAEDAERWLDRLRVRTNVRVQRHRGAIEALAAALLSHNTLSGEEIDNIVRQNGTPFVERIAAAAP